MHTNEFEKAFDDFLNRPEYDAAEGALFDIVRAAFEAGWSAASGAPVPQLNVIRLLRKSEPERE